MTVIFKFFKLLPIYLSLLYIHFFRGPEINFYRKRNDLPYRIVFIRKIPKFSRIAETTLQRYVIYLSNNNTYLRIKPKNFFEYTLKILNILGYYFREIFVLVYLFFWFICYYVKQIFFCFSYFFYYNMFFYFDILKKYQNRICIVIIKNYIYAAPFIFIIIFSKIHIYDELTAYNFFHIVWVHPRNHFFPRHELIVFVFSVYFPFIYLWMLFFWQIKDRKEFLLFFCFEVKIVHEHV